MAGIHYPNTAAEVYDHSYDVCIEGSWNHYPYPAAEVYNHACDVCIDFGFWFLTQSIRDIRVEASSG
jgi:hypothetical protein